MERAREGEAHSDLQPGLCVCPWARLAGRARFGADGTMAPELPSTWPSAYLPHPPFWVSAEVGTELSHPCHVSTALALVVFYLFWLGGIPISSQYSCFWPSPKSSAAPKHKLEGN